MSEVKELGYSNFNTASTTSSVSMLNQPTSKQIFDNLTSVSTARISISTSSLTSISQIFAQTINFLTQQNHIYRHVAAV